MNDISERKNDHLDFVLSNNKEWHSCFDDYKLEYNALPEIDFEKIEALVDEIIEYSKNENITLVFETFSRRYVLGMEYKGFVTAYRKQFLNTQFVETVMTYNM